MSEVIRTSPLREEQCNCEISEINHSIHKKAELINLRIKVRKQISESCHWSQGEYFSNTARVKSFSHLCLQEIFLLGCYDDLWHSCHVSIWFTARGADTAISRGGAVPYQKEQKTAASVNVIHTVNFNGSRNFSNLSLQGCTNVTST